MGGQELKCCNIIPAESIVVVEGPILLQDAWLKAGVAELLVPEIKQELGKWGSVTYKYCGLVKVHQISVTTSVWHGCTSHNDQEQHSLVNNSEKQQ